MLVWIGSGGLGVYLPTCNPAVDGAGDAMVHAICDLFIICHPLLASMIERVEVIAAEAGRASDDHVRLGYHGQSVRTTIESILTRIFILWLGGDYYNINIRLDEVYMCGLSSHMQRVRCVLHDSQLIIFVAIYI